MCYSGSHAGEERRNWAINWLFSANIDFSTIKDISLDSLWPKIQNNIDPGSNKYAHIYIADPIKIIGYFHKRRCTDGYFVIHTCLPTHPILVLFNLGLIFTANMFRCPVLESKTQITSNKNQWCNGCVGCIFWVIFEYLF